MLKARYSNRYSNRHSNIPRLAGLFALAVANLALTPNTQPEPGWQAWQPLTESSLAGTVSDVTTADFGLQFDFEQACERAAAPGADVSYWYRTSHLIEQIGIGETQVGCWANGSFLRTRALVSISLSPVTCLQVSTDRGRGLNIRSGPGLWYSRIGLAANGSQIRPSDSISALVTDDSGRQWLEIDTPQSGYVSLQAAPGEHLNLLPCN